MIQDLGSRKLYNEFELHTASADDKLFCFEKNQIWVKRAEDGQMLLPTVAQIRPRQSQYLFRIEDTRYFLAEADSSSIPPDFSLENVRQLRDLKIKELAFAAATAYHLYSWYRDNQFCGRCGKRLEHSKKERMLQCPSCGNMVFPKIAPAVIVAVTDGDRILLTKYQGRAYKLYALIAGFTEIGETAEETVRREVMEEVGLRVKNVTYYKSQPWGVDSNLLLGFFCELDGDDHITIDENELSTAVWFHRDEMPIEDDGFSLTREMMSIFKKGEDPYV